MPRQGISRAGFWLVIIVAVILVPHSTNADSPRHSFTISGAARSVPVSADQAHSMHSSPSMKSNSNGGHSSSKDQTVKSTKKPASHSNKDTSGEGKGNGGEAKQDNSKKGPATVKEDTNGSKRTKTNDTGHGTKSNDTKTTNNKGTNTKVTESKRTKSTVTDSKGTDTKMTRGPVQKRQQRPAQPQPQPQPQPPNWNGRGRVDKDHVKTILPLPDVADQTSDTVTDFLRASQQKTGKVAPAGGGAGTGGIKTPIKVKMTDSNQGGKNYYQNSDDAENGSGSITNPDSPFPAYMNFPTCTDRKGDITLTIVPEDTLGTPWAGWGTTLQWPGRFIGRLKSEKDRRLFLSLLFDPTDGLGLTRVRYMIPPGYNPTYSPAVATSWDHTYTSYSPAAGTYNFSADAAQVLAVQDALKVARDAGQPLHVDAISLSPPWWMTASKDVAGNTGGAQNLDPANMPAYAEYLITLAQHFKDEFGIRLESLAAMNEPLEMWWAKGGRHPGCSFTPDGVKQMYEALQSTRDDMDAGWLPLAAADSWVTVTDSLLRNTYRGRPPPFKYLTVHGYQTQKTSKLQDVEKALISLRTAASELGLPIWQTEWGPLGIPGNEMDIALFMGRSIAEHINILGVSVWYHFLALHYNNTLQWGALQQPMQVPGAPLDPKKTKQFYATLHFSRYITEGSILLKVSQQCQHGIVAVYTDAENRLAVTVTNQRYETFNIVLRFKDFAARNRRKTMTVSIYVTTDKQDKKLMEKQEQTSLAGFLNLAIPQRSITTVVITNVVNTANF